MTKKLKISQETQTSNRMQTDKQFRYMSYLAWYIDMIFRSMIALTFVIILIMVFFPKSSLTVKLVFLILLSPLISIPLNKIKIGVKLLNYIGDKIDKQFKK